MAEEIVDDADHKPSRKKGLLKIILIIVIAAVLGGGGYLGFAWFNEYPPFAPQGPSPEEIAAIRAEQEAMMAAEVTERFVSFAQPFTFNIPSGGRPHMMQFEVVLLVIGPENERLANEHLPLIGAVISEVAAMQQFDAMVAQTGRQRLKRILLEAIRARLSGLIHNPVVEQVLFTNFMIQ